MTKLTATTNHRPSAVQSTAPPPLTQPDNPLWVSVSEAAKIGGVSTKTIRRAIAGQQLNYQVNGNRYALDLGSLLVFLRSQTKLANKLKRDGLGQYVASWHDQ